MFGTGKSIILSFDDGPAPVDALKSILSTLELKKITGEFYVLGTEVKRHPAETKMIVSGGHRLQNHSWSHTNLATATSRVVRSELERTQAIIQEAAGVTPTKVRPPYGAGGWPGRLDPELRAAATALSLTIQNWDIDTEDWRAPRGIGGEKLTMIEGQFRRQSSKSTYDVLMHVQRETARDLPAFIETLTGWGFAFATH